MTILFAWCPLRHRVDNSDGFGIECGIHTFDNLRIGDTTVCVDDERHNHSSLSALLQSFFGIFHLTIQELHHTFVTTRELWHLLHHVEDSRGVTRFFCHHRLRLYRLLLHSFLLCSFLFYSLFLGSLGRLGLLHLNGLRAHFHLCIGIALLHHLLLWLLLAVFIHIVVYGFGVQRQGHTHDGQQSKQFQPAHACRFLIGKHHIYAVFKGTVTNTVGD